MPIHLPNRPRWTALVLLLLVLFMPLSARAAVESPEARAVVTRFLQAIGAPGGTGEERSSRAKGTLSAFGLTGVFEQWAARPDRTANLTTIGPFTLRDGFDGNVAWRVDQNGKFSRRDGKDLEEARASAWFANEMWLTPDQGGGAIRFSGRQSDSTGAYVVLQVVPPVGRERALWFSEKTGLLEREVAKHDERTVITRFSDYRERGGRLRPLRSRVEIEGMPMNTISAAVESLWTNPEIDPARFAPAERAVADARFLRGAGPARLPFRYASRHLWIKASLNGGPPEDFLLDTGASITVIDSAYAAGRGLKAEGKLQAAGAGAAGHASLAAIDSLRVEGPDGDGVAVVGQKVAVLSLNGFLEPFFWTKIAGILGYDFISRFVMEVDFDGSVLVLHDPATFRYAGAGEAIPMTMAGNIPVVKAKLDDRYAGEFRLDVGSGSTVDLHGPFVKKNDLGAPAGTHYDVVGGGFGGTFTSTVCRMKKMEIGPFSWEEPVVILSRAEAGGLASEDYAGNIGNHVLERFRCTFDYERRLVYLEPGRRYRQRDVFSRAGFQLARFGARTVAMQVLPGSPSDRAGLEAEDEVTALDGKPSLSYAAEDVRRMFEDGAPGEKHVLRVRRAGKTKTLRIVLAEML